MEVILFSQLGDKTRLKEQFPENTTLPKYKKIIDLLGPYLNPDITSLKQLLPSCDAPTYKASFLNQAITQIKEQPYYVEKRLVDLEALLVEIDNETEMSKSPTRFSDGTHAQDNSVNLAAETNNIDGIALFEQPLALTDAQLAQQYLLLKEA